jgi:hypothetical protein
MMVVSWPTVLGHVAFVLWLVCVAAAVAVGAAAVVYGRSRHAG